MDTNQKEKEPEESSTSLPPLSTETNPIPQENPTQSIRQDPQEQNKGDNQRRNVMSIVIPQRRNSNPFRSSHNVTIYPPPPQPYISHPHYINPFNSPVTINDQSLFPTSTTASTISSTTFTSQHRYLPSNPNVLLSDPSLVNKRFKPTEENYLVEDPFASNPSTSFPPQSSNNTNNLSSAFSGYNSEFSDWPQWIGGGVNPTNTFNNPSTSLLNPPHGNYYYDVNSLPSALIQTQQVFSTTSRRSSKSSNSSNPIAVRKNSNPSLTSSSTSITLNPNIEESDEDSGMDSNDPISQDGNVFQLREQPKPKQRKSYKKENRYLLPNPTQINLTESYKKKNGLPLDSLHISNANCTVKLVDGNGNQLPHSPSHYLEDTEGSLTKEYDAEQGGFEFTLKVRQNSGPERFRLAFQLKYTTSDGTQHKEKIISNAFLVQSNKSFFSKDPKLKGMHPIVGSHSKQNEIWIKGRDFNEKGVIVLVDGIQAEIVEIQSNLIICLTPIREDLKEEKKVKVEVSNLFKQKKVPSQQHFQFSYLVPTSEGNVRSELVFTRSASPIVASKEMSS